MSSAKKVVLAYSGGLDTSIILKWLQLEYGCEVITFTADLGQGEELEPAREKAKLLGIKPENIFIEDLREEFVRDFVFPIGLRSPMNLGTPPIYASMENKTQWKAPRRGSTGQH